MSNGQHQNIFQQDLVHDEKILWSGQPEPSVDFIRADIFLIPFSLLWGGFAFFWFGAVIFSGLGGAGNTTSAAAALMFYLVGMVFSIMGLYFIFGRFIYKRWKKRRTYYALTDRRAFSHGFQTTQIDGTIACQRRGGRL